MSILVYQFASVKGNSSTLTRSYGFFAVRACFVPDFCLDPLCIAAAASADTMCGFCPHFRMVAAEIAEIERRRGGNGGKKARNRQTKKDGWMGPHLVSE
jgi:hypothetical protein